MGRERGGVPDDVMLAQLDRELARSEPALRPADRSPRFVLLRDDDVERMPPPAWLVQDLVPELGLLEVHAPPESGKTFFMLGLALAVASGETFHGHAVQQGAVVYVAAEGSAGLGRRIGAWKYHAGRPDAAGVYFVTEPVNLMQARDVDEFIAVTLELEAPIRLVVFDTLHLCMAGGDDNFAKDMGLVVAAMDRIRRAVRATVAGVHHTTNSGDKERGSGSLRGAMDTMIELKREGQNAQILVTCAKQKDAAHFPQMALELAPAADSQVLITPETPFGVTGPMPGSKMHALLRSLQSAALEDEGLATSTWLRVSGFRESTFYDVRKRLVSGGWVDKRGSGRNARNSVSALGTEVLTTNSNFTPA